MRKLRRIWDVEAVLRSSMFPEITVTGRYEVSSGKKAIAMMKRELVKISIVVGGVWEITARKIDTD